MRSSDPNVSEPWSEIVHADDAKPRGSRRYFEAAVARLGPFKHKTRDAASLAPRSKDAVGFATSEEDARLQVQKLAENYNRHLRLELKAPRAKDVVQNLEKLQQVTEEFAFLLASFDDITKSRLQTAGSGLDQYIEIVGWGLSRRPLISRGYLHPAMKR